MNNTEYLEQLRRGSIITVVARGDVNVAYEAVVRINDTGRKSLSWVYRDKGTGLAVEQSLNHDSIRVNDGKIEILVTNSVIMPSSFPVYDLLKEANL
jgi:hypothetical protein